MDKPHLIIRLTIIGGIRLKDDFTVFYDERRVGRIRLAPGRVGQPWSYEWAINPPLPIPSWCAGSDCDLGRAKAAFREAWGRFYASLTPEAIAHWHRTADARK